MMNENSIIEILSRNSISANELAEYIRKAALYDAIVNYCEIARYPETETILAFCGERIKEEESEGGDNV